MDSESYEGWFGTPVKDKTLEEKKSEESNSISEQQNNSINQVINETEKDTKNFLGNKRVNNDSFEEEKYNNESEDKEEKPTGIFNNEIVNINYGESSDIEEDITTKKNVIEEEDEGKVKFKGFLSVTKKRYLREYVYLRTQNDFNLVSEKREYKWKIKFIKFSKKHKSIGIGLADKNVVIQNNNKFLDSENNTYNGVYCLYSKYDVDRKKDNIYAYNSKDNTFRGYIVNFPHFEQGQEIMMVYNSYTRILSFIPNKKVNKIYNMQGVMDEDSCTVATPCVVFYYPGDVIEISELEEN